MSNINAAVRNVTAERKKCAIKQQLNKLAPFCVERWGNRWCRLWSGARGTIGKGEGCMPPNALARSDKWIPLVALARSRGAVEHKFWYH